MTLVSEILDFWFGAEEGPQAKWFTVSAAFDREIKDRFLATYELAAAGSLDALQETPEGALALCLLLDQFPRNMFRGTPKAFATDEKARGVAAKAIERGWDKKAAPIRRWFFYLPFEHSEDIADQERAVALFLALGDKEGLKWAVAHRDIVARFGRFPHRNAILGRTSSAEELEFLLQPGSSF